MNCKYCGHGLPSRGGKCPGCGRMIPMDQLRDMRTMLDPRLNEYRNQDTAFYKSASNNDAVDKKIGNAIVLIVAVIIIIILIIIIKGASN